MNKTVVYLIIFLLLMSLTTAVINAQIVSIRKNSDEKIEKTGVCCASGFTPHSPICITDDEEFTTENGVTGGTGTKSDPYIIDGWAVEQIKVRYTSKHFRIENCKIVNASTGSREEAAIQIHRIKNHTCTIKSVICNDSNKATISLDEAAYVRIVDCMFTNHSVSYSKAAIYVGDQSSHTLIEDCSFNGRIPQSKWREYYNNGIRVGGRTTHVTIENCAFKNGYVGVKTNLHTVVRECAFDNFEDEGVFLYGNHVRIENCVFTNDTGAGIEIGYAFHNNVIKKCRFDGERTGVQFMVQGSGAIKRCCIENCSFTDCEMAADIYEAQLLNIHDNQFTKCGAGLVFRDDDKEHVNRSRVYNNYFVGNKKGIAVAPDEGTKVENNVFYNNYFEANTEDVSTEWMQGRGQGDLTAQQWNISKTKGENIVGGNWLGGNYWDEYMGVDHDEDGIGDTAVPFGPGDHLPLMDPAVQAPYQPVMPNGKEEGETDETYVYSSSTVDPQGDQVYYQWDWGDSSKSEWLGPYDSDEVCEASHQWPEEGTYLIRVKARDEEDHKSEWSDPLGVTMPLNKGWKSNVLWMLDNVKGFFSFFLQYD